MYKVDVPGKYDIQQLILGDESTFHMIYDQYSEKVYRLAFRFLKDREQSEEIVQETFINLWLSKGKLDPNGNIWLYLYVIAKRLSLNALREICKSADLTKNLLFNIAEVQNNCEEDILVQDLEQFIEKAVNQLPKQQQLIFKLSRIEGFSHKQIADQLGISTNTVKNHMVEALKTLKSNLRYADLVSFIILMFWF